MSFVTLSYCLVEGGDQPHKTTRQRIANDGSIAYGELPKSIQDAIKVIIELGYEYLWVDSLCIVQDDAEEMAREIAQMPLIYSNAIVNIVATAAKQASSGFLHDRNLEVRGPKITILRPDGTSEAVCLVRNPPWRRSHEYLDQRAWAMQERLLATRMLDYRYRQLQFHCSFTSNQPRYNDGGYQEPTVASNRWPQAHLPSSFPDSDTFHTYWYTLVHEYTGRQLTVLTDRSLAFSGIANKIHSQVQDTYIAGHWLSVLPMSLLWQRQHDRDSEWTKVRRKLHEPTWSWTSNVGPNELQKSLAWDIAARILGYEIELEGKSAPYGAFNTAVLAIEAPVKRIITRCPTNHDDSYYILIRDSQPPHCEHIEDYVLASCMDLVNSLDFLNEKGPENTPIYLLLVAKQLDENNASYGSHWTKGLILREESSLGVMRRFSRLGMFEVPWDTRKGVEKMLDIPTWIERFEEETIELL